MNGVQNLFAQLIRIFTGLKIFSTGLSQFAILAGLE